jgi:hypothetical protein
MARILETVTKTKQSLNALPQSTHYNFFLESYTFAKIAVMLLQKIILSCAAGFLIVSSAMPVRNERSEYKLDTQLKIYPFHSFVN